MKRVTITNDSLYNIVRTERGKKTIFLSNLSGADAKTQLAHWKRMARNSGGKVYFDAVPVPKDLGASVNRVGNGAEPIAA